MANQEQLDILKQGIKVWNEWREEHVEIRPNLSFARLYGANLSFANLNEANLSRAELRTANLSRAELRTANLSRARLSKADLIGADLTGADLSEAVLNGATLSEAILSGATLSRGSLNDTDLRDANLSGADLSEALLRRANLRRANLSGADLNGARLVETTFADATLINCKIYGISAWNVKLEGAKQNNLVITSEEEPTITVDNLEVAQFIYLLLNNKKIRDVIDTITSKLVLILGRFTPERKVVLDALRDELRKQNYTPVLFDFEKPASRDFTETIRTLAHLARFIIADLTDPSSIPQELQAIVPDLEVPVQPLLLEEKREYSMFVDFRKFHWVLPIYLYKDQTSLIASLKNEIIEPADKKARELAVEKAKRLERP